MLLRNLTGPRTRDLRFASTGGVPQVGFLLRFDPDGGISASLQQSGFLFAGKIKGLICPAVNVGFGEGRGYF